MLIIITIAFPINRGERHPHTPIDSAAGAGREADDESILTALSFNKIWLDKMGVQPNEAGLIYVIGDSMEPKILNGAITLFDRQKQSVNKKAIFAFSEDGELRVKYLERDKQSLIISSANPNYPDERRNSTDANAIKIIGQIIWTASTL